MCKLGVQKGAVHTALRIFCADGEREALEVDTLDHLWPFYKFQDPYLQVAIQIQILQIADEPAGMMVLYAKL